jgi:hypothetical protein
MTRAIDGTTMNDESEKPGNGAGRPVTHMEGWSRVTIVLMNRQIVYLDRLSADIRARTGAVVKRTEIIRALIDSLAESPIDTTSIEGEDDLRRLLREHVERAPIETPSAE